VCLRGRAISTACYMSGMSSEERDRQQEQLADVEEKLADVEEATEQRMHSVADLIPEKSERSTSVPTDCLRMQRSTTVEFSAVAPMTTNGIADSTGFA
jgi:hypothetical protein